MSIADKITSIETHLENDYEGLENLGVTAEDRNIENIRTCLDELYNNLPKTTDTGINLSLNTLKGKMGIIPKGNIEQTQYSGYNELNIYAVHPKGYTEVVSGVTITYNDNGSVTANGTATADISYFLGSRASLGDMFNGTYYLSGCTNGSLTTYFLQMWAETSGTYQQTTTEVTTNKVSGKNWNVTIQIKNGASVNYTFYPMMSATSGKSFEPFVGNTASPNPTYPQNIEVVTGTQTIQVSNSDNTETQTQTLSLGDIELCKIGTYQDYIYKNNGSWYVKKNIGKYTFTGNETIDQFSSRTNTIRFSIANVLPTTLVAQEYNYNAYCNYLKAQDIYNNDVQGFFTHFNGISATRIYIGLGKTIASTSEQAKTWLGNVKPILYYQLRTPNDIEITDTNLISQLNNLEKLKSYNGVTNINCSGNLSAILGVSALKGE